MNDIGPILRRLASVRHGVITRQELLEGGMPPSAIDRALRSGLLIRVHPGVYVVGGVPDLWATSALASVFYTETQARRKLRPDQPEPVVALTGVGAAALHDVPYIDRPGTPVVATNPLSRARLVLTTHRPTLTAADVVTRGFVPVTRLGWTMGELAASLLRSHAMNAMAELVREGRLSVPGLLATAARMGEDGRHLEELVRSARPEDFRARSDNERVLFHNLVRAGVEPPVVNHRLWTPVRPIELDHAWLERLLNVEIDGPHHDTLLQQRRDRARDDIMDDMGWTVHRVDARRVRHDIVGVVAEIKELIEKHPRSPNDTNAKYTGETPFNPHP